MTEFVDPQTGELIDTDSIPGLATVAGLHEAQLYRLAVVVEELQEDALPGSTSSAPWNWRTLRGSAAEAQWHDLAEWVGWLRSRYPLAQQVPLCWWRHTELVEELTALWLAWKDAYVAKHAHFTAPADWHSRWLPDFLRRVGAGGWNIACEGEHRDRVTSLYDERGVDDEAAFKAFVANGEGRGQPSEESRVEEKAMVEDQEMQAALASGEARTVGEMPDSPVAYRGGYWVHGEAGWVPVEDENTIVFLADAERRLRLADEAVERSEQP